MSNLEANKKKINQIILVIMVINLAVALTKIGLGHISQSGAIRSDGYHSLSDGLNNLIGVVAIRFAYQPADENHPYGHKKIETLLSLGIAIVLCILAYNIAHEAIFTFFDAAPLHLSNVAIMIMLATLIINLGINYYEKKMGKLLNSAFLISDAAHTMSDVYVSIAVMISIIGIRFFNLPYYFDNIMSLVVVIFIVKAAFEIGLSASKVLTDYSSVDHKQLEDLVYSFPQVINVHKIRSRGFEDEPLLDFHVVVKPDMSLVDAHDLADQIEKKIKSVISENANVTIHMEPDRPEKILTKKMDDISH